MPFSAVLIANRGEIAVRLVRAVAALGLKSIAVYSDDDRGALHTRLSDEARPLGVTGAPAYLDTARILSIAKDAGAGAIHPGYGFLSEQEGFAAACAEAGLVFVGPSPRVLALLGDKTAARELAARAGVPVLEATQGPTSLEGARAFWKALGPGAGLIVKAVAGGGGRGTRAVTRPEDLDEAFARAASEAEKAFGNGALYVERFLDRARHVEVQLLGDGQGQVTHLWERECSLQRRFQKLVEMAPAPDLHPELRRRILDAALALGREAGVESLVTAEFLVEGTGPEAPFFFIEANPRLQVEHTVTEEVTGIDLVETQLRLAAGASLADLGLGGEPPAPRGFALQARVNMERMTETGEARPASGTLARFAPPSGPGVRVDTFGETGLTPSPRFDSLLAKLIVHARSGGLDEAASKAAQALREFAVTGIDTNIPFLRALFADPEFTAPNLHTRFLEEHAARLAGAAQALAAEEEEKEDAAPAAGARIDRDDPLAVLAHGKSGTGAGAPVAEAMQEGEHAVRAAMQGTIVSLEVQEGATVAEGTPLLVMEAMKMEHVITADVAGRVLRLPARPGEAVPEGHALAVLEPGEGGGRIETADEAVDLDRIRPDLQEILDRQALGQDAARPDMVARRRKTGQRTARENLDDLIDPGSYIEYGSMVIAAQRRRRTVEDLAARTPADGLVAGIGTVNADQFGPERARCAVMSYDYTVLAGTQGWMNHKKKDRLFEVAERLRLPVVFFAEGGGGRPGDTDANVVAGLDCLAFALWGGLSGLVPLVAIVSGRCFAGNAAILGCADVIIATQDSTIGMGGPAMIEGGGLGVFRPEEVGPIGVQTKNGVVDIAVADEAEAVAAAKRYLSYFQGPVEGWTCADQRLLRSAIPENRLRIYDVRRVIETLADEGSVLELRRDFGLGMVTALIRVEGRPMGLVANNPAHLAGAIDSPGADKAARFLQLCDAHDLPVLFLCDTPGIMVGPEAEKTALVRHASRLFVTGASLTVPFFSVVLRKGYGLGAQAMAGGGFKGPVFSLAWPTGEFGGMGLEGAVKLGFRKELEAETDPEARKALFEKMVASAYEQGKALNLATYFEIDEVIDPAETRHWLVRGLQSLPPAAPREGKKRPCIDTW